VGLALHVQCVPGVIVRFLGIRVLGPVSGTRPYLTG